MEEIEKMSIKELFELHQRDELAARVILFRSLDRYLQDDPDRVAEIMAVDEQLDYFETLKGAGAKLTIDDVLETAAPYHAYVCAERFIDYGADANALAKKIFACKGVDFSREGELIAMLLGSEADALELLRRCLPYIEWLNAPERNKFLDLFKGYLPEGRINWHKERYMSAWTVQDYSSHYRRRGNF